MQVDGIEEMLLQIERMGKDVEKIKEKAILKGALVLRQEMAQRVSRATSQGRHISDNIIVTDIKGEGDEEKYVLVGAIERSRSSPEFFYDRWLEWGTLKMLAKPFGEPSVISKRQEVLDKIADVIRGELIV